MFEKKILTFILIFVHYRLSTMFFVLLGTMLANIGRANGNGYSSGYSGGIRIRRKLRDGILPISNYNTGYGASYGPSYGGNMWYGNSGSGHNVGYGSSFSSAYNLSHSVMKSYGNSSISVFS